MALGQRQGAARSVHKAEPRHVPCAKASTNMRTLLASTTLVGVLSAVVACGGPGDEAPTDSGESVAKVQEPALATAWTVATTTMQAIQLMYKAKNWFDCDLGGTCPESEAQVQSRRIINELEAAIAVYDTDSKISDVRVLLDRAALDYAHPELVAQGEEQDLVNDLRDVYFHFRDRLNNTDATNQAQVNSAYALAPFFNLLAALVDNVAHTALANGRCPWTSAGSMLDARKRWPRTTASWARRTSGTSAQTGRPR